MPQVAPDAHAGKEDNGDIPPAFHKDMTLREMKPSFKSNKGALTRLLNQVKVRAWTFITIKSQGSATQLNEFYNKFLAKCNFLHREAHQLAPEDEKNSALGQMHRTNYNRCKRQLNTSTATPRYNWASEFPHPTRELWPLELPRSAFVTISSPGSSRHQPCHPSSADGEESTNNTTLDRTSA